MAGYWKKWKEKKSLYEVIKSTEMDFIFIFRGENHEDCVVSQPFHGTGHLFTLSDAQGEG